MAASLNTDRGSGARHASAAVCAVMLLLGSCAKPEPVKDSTGLCAGMSITEAERIMGQPDTVKNAGKNKLIHIYRHTNETVIVFFINDRIKNIDHSRAIPFM